MLLIVCLFFNNYFFGTFIELLVGTSDGPLVGMLVEPHAGRSVGLPAGELVGP